MMATRGEMLQSGSPLVADGEWARRNLGVDPTQEAAMRRFQPTADDGQSLHRELIDFDSEDGGARELAAIAPKASTGLSRFVDIEWPAGLAPKPGPKPTGQSLPQAALLLVPLTVDAGH